MRTVIIIAFLFGVTTLSGIHVSCAARARGDAGCEHLEPCVYVHGPVRSPGGYRWFPGMTFQDAIRAAGGFTNYFHGKVVITHNDGIHVSHGYETKASDPYNLNPPVLQKGDVLFISTRVF